MAARRVARRGLLPPVAVVEADPRILSDNAEVAVLRHQEQEKALYNDVATVVMNVLVNATFITQATRRDAFDAAVLVFRDRLPEGMIRVLVNATITQEFVLRHQATVERARQKREREHKLRPAGATAPGMVSSATGSR